MTSRLNTQQIATIAITLLIGVAILVWGRRQPPQQRPESATADSLTTSDLLLQSISNLDSSQASTIRTLEAKLNQAQTVTEEIEALKILSKTWNNLGNFIAGGVYAERVAQLTPATDTAEAETAWAIAGTTFGIGMQRTEKPAQRNFAAQRARAAFERAQTLNPSNNTHRVNLALTYVQGSDEPMKGILMLREVVEQDPTNIPALMALGRFALQTAQYDKAAQRFETVVVLPQATNDILLEAHYALGDCYSQLNDLEKARLNVQKCMSYAPNAQVAQKIREDFRNLLPQ